MKKKRYICAICTLKMGEFHPSTSMKFSWCQTGNWQHKSCMRKIAFDMRDAFKCPSYDNIDTFRENMLYNGIFIPTFSETSDLNSSRSTEGNITRYDNLALICHFSPLFNRQDKQFKEYGKLPNALLSYICQVGISCDVTLTMRVLVLTYQ